MAGNTGNKGKGGGGQPKVQKCSLCPSGQERMVPSGRSACLECVPEYVLKTEGKKGTNDFQVLVTTLKNGKPCSLEFSWSVDGGDWTKEQTANNQDKSLAQGTKVVSISYRDKKRIATFVFGAETQSVEVPVDPKKAIPSVSTEPVPQYAITAKAVNFSRGVEVLVRTFCNGHPISAPFIWSVDGEQFRYDQTDNGKKTNHPIGTKIVAIDNSSRIRRARFFVSGGQEGTEIEIQPQVGKFHPADLSAETDFEITTDVSVLENRCDVLIQTYVGGKQEGCWFCWQVEGETFRFDHTTDDYSSTEPKGTKVISIDRTDKKRKLVVQLIGKNLDVRNLELPAKKNQIKWQKPDPKKSTRENRRRALNG